MSASLSYLAAKAIQFESLLDWIGDQSYNLSDLHAAHPHVHRALTSRLAQARARLTQLKIVVQLNSAVLAPRGLSIANALQFDTFVLSDYYLAALRREGDDERQFARLVRTIADGCGLRTIQEVLVHFGGGHAIFPAILECPVLFAPPHQRYTLVDLVGIYHELGHVVFRQHDVIGDTLTRAVRDHFHGLEQGVGPLHPSQREERTRQIRRAREYWTSDRLDELSGDVFATYTVGPAYYYSTVDMAIAYGFEAREVDVTDEHPPVGARITVCRIALPPAQQGEEISVAADQLWSEFQRFAPSSADYRLFCADDLLRSLTDTCIQSLTSTGYLQYGSRRAGTQAGAINIEEILNEAALRMLEDPAQYRAWEEPAIRRIFS